MIELFGHLRDPALGDPLNAELPHQALDPSGRHATDVGLDDHLDEGPFGPPAWLEQPVGEVAALPQLGDGEVDRAGPGVPRPRPVAVAAVRAFIGSLAVRGAADRVGLLAHHPLAEELHHLSQQVRIRLLDLLAKPGETVHRGIDHRAPPPRVPADLVEDDAVVFSFNDPQVIVRTPRLRTLLGLAGRKRGCDQRKHSGAGWTRTTGLRIMSPLIAFSLPAETAANCRKCSLTCHFTPIAFGRFG